MRIYQIPNKIIHYLNQLPLWQSVLAWSKEHSLPGLKRIPIYNIVQFIREEAQKDTLVTRANSMAFSFFLAIFPSIIFLITLLPYLPYGENFFITLESSIKQIMPGNSGGFVFNTISDLLKTERRNLLSFGFLLALWFSSNGMLSMMNGLRKDYREVFKRRNAWEKRIIALQLTFLLSFVLFASVVFVILGNTILNFVFSYIHTDWLTRGVIFAFRWVVIIALFYTGISLIYRYGTSTHRPIPFLNAGATLATFISIPFSWGFSFYTDNFGNFNTVYGSIGTVMVLMVWIQLNCFVLLVGFELNASIAVLRERRRSARIKETEQQESATS